MGLWKSVPGTLLAVVLAGLSCAVGAMGWQVWQVVRPGRVSAVAADLGARALVLSGAGGHFCAGADFSGFLALMQTAPGQATDPIAHYNRQFGGARGNHHSAGFGLRARAASANHHIGSQSHAKKPAL